MRDRAAAEWEWGSRTHPFVDRRGREPARFVLEQVADDRFAVHRSFRYDPDGLDVEVSSKTLVDTDLASIPLFMAWFVPVNGRHTPAALVHDELVAASRRAADPVPTREHADAVFLEAMRATDVPVLRRRLMHAAVVLATRWSSGFVARAAVLLWALASLAGTVLLVASVASGRWWGVAIALVAPTPAALLWGRRAFGPGVLAGYAAWFVVVPAAATLAGYVLYWLAEEAVRSVLTLGRRRRADLPAPAPYQ